MRAAAGLVTAALLLAAAAAEARIVRIETPNGPVYTNVPEPAADVEVRPSAKAERFRHLISAAAARHGLDPRLIEAVMACESNFDPQAVSRAGACGLMQLMPATARQYGLEDPFDPAGNVEAGVRHLAGLLRSFGGDRRLAIAAYNAGEGAVRRNSGVPPYRETRTYVRRVLGYVAQLGGGEPPSVAASAAEPSVAPVPPRRGQTIRMRRDAEGRLVLTNRRAGSAGGGG